MRFTASLYTACCQPLVPCKLLVHLTKHNLELCSLVMSGGCSKITKNNFLVFPKTRNNMPHPLKAWKVLANETCAASSSGREQSQRHPWDNICSLTLGMYYNLYRIEPSERQMPTPKISEQISGTEISGTCYLGLSQCKTQEYPKQRNAQNNPMAQVQIDALL